MVILLLGVKFSLNVGGLVLLLGRAVIALSKLGEQVDHVSFIVGLVLLGRDGRTAIVTSKLGEQVDRG